MSKRILVVEDERTLRGLRAAQLKFCGLEADFALDGMEAVQRFGEQSYSLVLMDIALPRLSGLDACRRMRAWEQEKNLAPAIVVAVSSEAQIGECLAAGMNDFYQKPLLMPQLRELLQRWFHA